MKEIWRPISEYEGIYEVSSTGRVRSLDHAVKQLNNGVMTTATYKGRELKIMKRPNGYCCVHLSKNNVSKWMSVHRLVATAFVEKPEGCDIVNHLDCDTTNNRADNLEWTTYSGNMKHASLLGHMKGSPNNWKKATEQRKRAVIAIDAKGQTYSFNSQVEASKILGVQRSHIASACKKQRGYKTLKGYTFFYKEEMEHA